MKAALPIVGTRYLGADTVRLVRSLNVGHPLTLVRDPKNPHDLNAIEVWADDHMIGFIPRSENSDLAKAIDNDGFFCKRSGNKAFSGRLAIGPGGYLVEIEYDG